MFIIFNNVSFGYSSPIFQNISFTLSQGWTGVIGPNGSGKTTLLKLASGILHPNDGTVRLLEHTVYCDQRTDDQPECLEEFLLDYSKDAILLRARLLIGEDWLMRWETLSHGERKRAQIGTALWQNPDVLAIDEPTNHLDLNGKKLLIAALKRFDGIGIIISHDRELLDVLPSRCLFIESGNVVSRPGTRLAGFEQIEQEQRFMEHTKETLTKDLRRLEAEAGRKREMASRANSRRSKRHIDIRDHDAKARIDTARVSGKDGVYGKLLNQMSGRIEQQESLLNGMKSAPRVAVHFRIPESYGRKRTVIHLPSGEITYGTKSLIYPELTVRTGEKIALTGNNGVGKSSLIQHIIADSRVPDCLYIPQEIPMEQSRDILAEIKKLDNQAKGEILKTVHGLGSDPLRILATPLVSPGELRKLLLALGILESPVLMIMDEPTNHMDLPSVLCLEEALKNSPISMILVSHDDIFLNSIVGIRWEITQEAPDAYRLDIVR